MFTPLLATTPHFTKQLANAQPAFVAIKGLSRPGIGLPSYLCHQLAASDLFPILSYVGNVFHLTVHMVRKLAVFWHKLHTWCTNCFTCAPTNIVGIEACLPPDDLLLTYQR